MATVSVSSHFGTQEKKICHYFQFSPFNLSWIDGIRGLVLSFCILSFMPAFSLSSFTIFKRLFSSSSLSAIRVVSFVYLGLLIFLPAVLISVYVWSSPAFLMVSSAYKLNKQGDNIQPWPTHFPVLNLSIVPCLFLTVASWLAYSLVRRQVKVVWYSHLLKNFP